MLYLISYDINEQQFDYLGLKETIKTFGDYQHPMETLWFVKTNVPRDVNEMTERLRNYLHSADTIFVMQLPENPTCQGWLPRAFWKWLGR
jgi:hypothetical protein